jgi:hypothetical protein
MALAFKDSAVLKQRSLPAAYLQLHSSSPGRRINPPGRGQFFFLRDFSMVGVLSAAAAQGRQIKLDCAALLP